MVLAATEGGGQAPARPARREALIPASVLGMLLFVAVEVMMFAGFISAHTVVRASALGGLWPPPGQPRLPVGVTAFNTVLLLLSGVALVLAVRAMASTATRVRTLLLSSVVLGGAFVGLQGVEWVRLLHEGLTLTSSTHGGFFYVIVGAHGLHALAGIAALAWAMRRHDRGVLRRDQLQAIQVFWLFVVGMWPILYWRLYL